MYQLPSDKGKYLQSNTGESSGNIFATYGIDLQSNRGKLRSSQKVVEVLTDVDNANFDGYAAAIVSFGTSSPKTYAVSDKVFSALDITGTWAEETAGTEPDSGNTIMDAVFFDGLLLVSEADDIKAFNGSTWSSWWRTTKGQSALVIGERHLLEVGADNNLYIVDDGNKVYRVDGATGAVTKTGNGTLDFSDTNYQFETIDASSTRMWLSARDKSGNTNAIVEWDMSPASATANKIHRIGNAAARCIAIWEDLPIAILQNGRILYFDNFRFKDWPNIRLPIKRGTFLSNDFIHPNGWAIIDDLPHFLMTGRLLGNNVKNTSEQSEWTMPAGVYCLDPEFGLYNRFPIGIGDSTDNGQLSIRQVGALSASLSEDSKFLCSYEYTLPNDSTVRSVLAYHDKSKTLPLNSFIVTPFIASLKELYKVIDVYHSVLSSGESIKLYFRNQNTDPVTLQGTWQDNRTFNALTTNTGIVAGNIAMIKTGKSAGKIIKISEVNESATVTSIVLSEPTGASASDVAAIDVLDFKFMGQIDNTTKDYSDFSIPQITKRRKLQVLIEIRSIAASTIELDNVIIT